MEPGRDGGERSLDGVLEGLAGLLEYHAEAGGEGLPDPAPPGPARRAQPSVPDAPPAPPPAPPATASGPLTLEQVRAELGECTRCKLSEGRTKIVFGVGNPKADIVFIGEGPGQDEDRVGEPFVGKAGQLLTQIIEKGMGLARADVYIMNIVKCRPPGNRDPEPDEIAACRPFLEKQIEAIRPRVLVSLGKPSSSTLLGRPVPITKLRGQWQEYCGIPLMPTYHPAYVLRRYTPEVRREVWEDMKEVLRKVGREPPAGRGER